MLTCTKYDKAHYLPSYIVDLIDEWSPVGSRETCNPPPTDTDQDILILTEGERFYMLREELQANNWVRNLGEGYENLPSSFYSYKKTHEDNTLVNLILTKDPVWFEKFMQAHFSCKEKNLLSKAARIAEFKKFLPQPEYKNTIYDDYKKYFAKMQSAQNMLGQMAAQQQAPTQGILTSGWATGAGIFGVGTTGNTSW